jgi:hypothetical protein
VQLLRRQPNVSSPSLPSSHQVTARTAGDARQASHVKTDSTPHTPMKETVDPSLLEAFANPMNRQYLLQLEASLNNFVSQSRLDLFRSHEDQN